MSPGGEYVISHSGFPRAHWAPCLSPGGEYALSDPVAFPELTGPCPRPQVVKVFRRDDSHPERLSDYLDEDGIPHVGVLLEKESPMAW